MPTEKYVTGSQWGDIVILERIDHTKSRMQCERCGSVFKMTTSEVIRRYPEGCPKCGRKAVDRHKDSSDMVGKTFGRLTVLKASAGKVTCRCECGRKVTIPASRVRAGQAKQCDRCGEGGLKQGWQITQDAAKGGSSLMVTSSKRAVNKNSSTGIRGVGVYHKPDGRVLYRAYITFCRRQYSLGLYSDLETAKAARQAAEKRLFGGFREWYAENYPAEWERMKDKIGE